MALTLIVEGVTGETRRVPVLTNEEVVLKQFVAKATLESTYINSREDLEERRYKATDIERAIQNLREGDVLRVSPYPKSQRDREVVVQISDGDVVDVKDENDNNLVLYSNLMPRNSQRSGPWMRTYQNNDSLGEIREIEILSLSSEE